MRCFVWLNASASLLSDHGSLVFGNGFSLGSQQRSAIIFIPLQNKCFQGYTGNSLSVCVSVCQSVYKILVSVSAGEGIKSHLVTGLVIHASPWLIKYICVANT